MASTTGSRQRRCSTTQRTGEQRGGYRTASLLQQIAQVGKAAARSLRDSLVRLRDHVSLIKEQPRQEAVEVTFASSTRSEHLGRHRRVDRLANNTREKRCRCADPPAAPPRHRTPKQAAVDRGEQRPLGSTRDRWHHCIEDLFSHRAENGAGLRLQPASSRRSGAARLPMTWCRPVAAACTRLITDFKQAGSHSR